MSEGLRDWLKRLCAALPLAGFCGYSVVRAFQGGDHALGSMAWLLYAAGMLILIAAIFAFPIAGIIGEHFGRLYLPGGSEVPPPHYPMAGIYEREAKWNLALAEYDKIIFYHPDELAAHAARVRLALHAYHDEPLARRFLSNSLRCLRNRGARRELQQFWESLAREPREI